MTYVRGTLRGNVYLRGSLNTYLTDGGLTLERLELQSNIYQRIQLFLGLNYRAIFRTKNQLLKGSNHKYILFGIILSWDNFFWLTWMIIHVMETYKIFGVDLRASFRGGLWSVLRLLCAHRPLGSRHPQYRTSQSLW